MHYPGTNRTDTFILRNNVAIYGGFAGTESSRNERNWQTRVTVLSGDIDRNDITDPQSVVTTTANLRGSNAYHVVNGSRKSNTAILDGFVITAGQANGSLPDNSGGGMFNLGGNATLANLTFSGNLATYGGGMFNWNNSSSILTD